MDLILNNSLATLGKELEWLEEIISYRLKDYFEQVVGGELPIIPELEKDDSYYAQFTRHHGLGEIDRLVMIIALAPHLRPSIFDIFFTKNKQYDKYYAEFGVVRIILF